MEKESTINIKEQEQKREQEAPQVLEGEVLGYSLVEYIQGLLDKISKTTVHEGIALNDFEKHVILQGVSMFGEKLVQNQMDIIDFDETTKSIKIMNSIAYSAQSQGPSKNK